MMVSNQHLITLDNPKLKSVMKNIHKLQSPLKSSSIKWRFMTVLGSKIIKVKNTKYQILSLSKDYWIFTKTLNWSLWLMSHISVRPEQISCPNWSETYTKHSKLSMTSKKVCWWSSTEQEGTILLKTIKNKSRKWSC